MRNKINKLKDYSKKLRKLILETSYNCGAPSHIGGALSIADIMTVIYYNIMKDNSFQKDRFILSKGHGFLALLTILFTKRKITKKELLKFQKNGSEFIAHPIANQKIGIESSNGSLGQGLSFGIGIAISYKKRKTKGNIFVLLGDGECYEGSVWEAATTASEYNLNNLVVIVDCNGHQNDGAIGSGMTEKNMHLKWKSFGWDVKRCNGHDIVEIIDAFKNNHSSKPKAIIAKTIKGKGVKFMENNNDWHHGMLSKKLLDRALDGLN